MNMALTVRRVSGAVASVVATWVLVAACGGGIPSAAPAAPAASVAAADDPYAEAETTVASSTPSVAPVASATTSQVEGRIPTSLFEACRTISSASSASYDRVAAGTYLKRRRDAVVDVATRALLDMGVDASCTKAPRPTTCTFMPVSDIGVAYDALDYGRRLRLGPTDAEDSDAALINFCAGGGELEMAERTAKLAREAADRHIAKKKAEDDAKAEKAARVKAVETMKTTTAACDRDIAACKATCAKDVSAYECVYFGMLYMVGDKRVGLSAPDYRKALSTFDAACGAGNIYACNAKSVLRDESKACSGADCEAYCAAGFGGSCVIRGEELRDDKKLAAAAGWFQKGCDANDGMSCNDLGTAYFMGEGVGTNRAKAETLFKKACDLAQAEIDAIPAGRSVPPMVLARRDTSCRNFEGTVCVNKVQTPAQRRPGKDDMCRKITGRGTAWATLDGTDSDECMNAMMNRGCQEAMGLKAYCCPSK